MLFYLFVTIINVRNVDVLVADIVCKLKARVRVNVYESFFFFLFGELSFWIKLSAFSFEQLTLAASMM